MSEKPISFSQAWVRGWKVILMLFVLSLSVGLCEILGAVLLRLLPTAMKGVSGGVFCLIIIVITPPVVYWVFSLFFSYEEPRPQKDLTNDISKPSTCLLCHSVIPAGSEACPRCGWTYKDS